MNACVLFVCLYRIFRYLYFFGFLVNLYLREVCLDVRYVRSSFFFGSIRGSEAGEGV